MTDAKGKAAKPRGDSVEVARDSDGQGAYLVTRDEFGETSARLYANVRGTPITRAREKRLATVFEIVANNLSDVYRSDDDPSDWGRSMGITIAEIRIAPHGGFIRDVIVETDANVAMAPYPSNAFAGFGRHVNALLSAWGLM